MNVGDVGHFQDFFYSPEKSFYKKVLDFAYTAYTANPFFNFYQTPQSLWRNRVRLYADRVRLYADPLELSVAVF